MKKFITAIVAITLLGLAGAWVYSEPWSRPRSVAPAAQAENNLEARKPGNDSGPKTPSWSPGLQIVAHNNSTTGQLDKVSWRVGYEAGKWHGLTDPHCAPDIRQQVATAAAMSEPGYDGPSYIEGYLAGWNILQDLEMEARDTAMYYDQRGIKGNREKSGSQEARKRN